MKQCIGMVVAFVLATGALFAQAVGPASVGTGGTLLINAPKGIFALRGGVLAKYDTTTLKAVQVFSLFGPAPEQPAQGADRDAIGKYYAEMQRRGAPAIMLVKDNSLLVVIGDNFARISQENIQQIEAKADLKPQTATEENNGGRFRVMETAPGYLLVGNTLYLLRSKEMLAITITDGKVVHAALPNELQPVQMTFMGARGGQGGNRGNQ